MHRRQHQLMQTTYQRYSCLQQTAVCLLLDDVVSSASSFQRQEVSSGFLLFLPLFHLDENDFRWLSSMTMTEQRGASKGKMIRRVAGWNCDLLLACTTASRLNASAHVGSDYRSNQWTKVVCCRFVWRGIRRGFVQKQLVY